MAPRGLRVTGAMEKGITIITGRVYSSLPTSTHVYIYITVDVCMNIMTTMGESVREAKERE